VDQCPALDAAELVRRLREAQPDRWERWEGGGGPVMIGPVSWTLAGAPSVGAALCSVTASVSVAGLRGSVRVAWRRGDERGQQMLEMAAYVTSRPIGPRWLFGCPVTYRPAAKLYLAPTANHWASRQGHGLVYRTSDQSPAERAAARALRLRRALGEESPRLGGQLPPQPRRLRSEVYRAAVEELKRLELLASVAVAG
jgi:hypothetical protein